MKNEIYIFLVLLGLIVLICILYIYRQNQKKRNDAWLNRFSEENQVEDMKSNEPSMICGREKNNVWFKVQMYVISLCLLFVLIIPITIRFPDMDSGFQQLALNNQIITVCKNNILLIICFVMACAGYLLFKELENRWRGTRNLSVQITEVEGKNFEYLTFLTTYIIPLVCIDLEDTRYIVVLIALLTIIGIIFVRSDFYLGNPTLALMNYRLYRVKYRLSGDEYERIVITKDRLEVDDYIESIPFDKSTWYVRRIS